MQKLDKVDLNLEKLNKLYWKNNLSISNIGNIYNLHPTAVLKRMKKYGIPRRSLSQSSFIVYKDKPKFILKEKLSHEEELLKIAGLMLYCCEGSFKGSGIDFANSNPKIILLFLEFLRKICGVAEKRLSVYLYAFANQDVNNLKLFWSKITNIPLNQFSKPYIKKAYDTNTAKMEYGLVKIRYYDKKLLKVLENCLDTYYNQFLNTNGQVAERSMATDCK
jgi:hypothetical protein